MEFRYYIIFGSVFIVLQFLIFSFSKTLNWLFNISAKKQKFVFITAYLIGNSFFVLHFLRLFSVFRAVALMLALLLFAFFVSAGVWLIFRLGKKWIEPNKLSRALKIAYPFGFFGLIGLAVYNAYIPKVLHYHIQLDKPIQPLKIGVASDFHLGRLFGAKQLDKLADIMQREKVDLILLPGDIMDDNVEYYLKENMQPHLAKLTAPLGVYATMGNHDLFGHQTEIRREIEKAGITLLWDQTITLNNQLVIIGRNDDLVKDRPTAEQLLAQVDTRFPVFLLDHRPTDILQHSRLPIDLQVSGHAHNGQIFPANLITKMMYELSYGYRKIGQGHYFVTSGFGFWGIPMRLGSQSEVLIIEVTGQ